MAEAQKFFNYVYHFGCWGRYKGHYLHAPGGRDHCRTFWHDRMQNLDGQLAPTKADATGYEPQFKAKFWRLTGFTPAEYSALSWWDRSIDSRHASNTIIFVPGHTVDAETSLRLANEYFPEVMSRLPAIELLPGEHRKTWGEPR